MKEQPHSPKPSRRGVAVLRYPLCVLVSAIAWAFAFCGAVNFMNLLRIDNERIIIRQDNFHLLGLPIGYGWGYFVLFVFVSAAIAVIAWHFRKEN